MDIMNTFLASLKYYNENLLHIKCNWCNSVCKWMERGCWYQSDIIKCTCLILQYRRWKKQHLSLIIDSSQSNSSSDLSYAVKRILRGLLFFLFTMCYIVKMYLSFTEERPLKKVNILCSYYGTYNCRSAWLWVTWYWSNRQLFICPEHTCWKPVFINAANKVLMYQRNSI